MNFDPYIILYQITSSISNFHYWQYVIIALAVFLLLFVFAKERRFALHFHKRGALFGFFFGILLMIGFDLIFIMGISDKEKLGKLFSEENRKVALGEVMASGVNNLSRVLGASTFVSTKKPETAREVLMYFVGLPTDQAKVVRETLCQ